MKMSTSKPKASKQDGDQERDETVRRAKTYHHIQYPVAIAEDGAAHVIVVGETGEIHELIYSRDGKEWHLHAEPDAAFFLAPDDDCTTLANKIQNNLVSVDLNNDKMVIEDIGGSTESFVKNGFRWTLLSEESLGYCDDGLSFGYSSDRGNISKRTFRREYMNLDGLRTDALRRSRRLIVENFFRAVETVGVDSIPDESVEVFRRGENYRVLRDGEQFYISSYTRSDSTLYQYRIVGIRGWVSGITTFGEVGENEIERGIQNFLREIDGIEIRTFGSPDKCDSLLDNN